MRCMNLCIVLCALPAAILGNTRHVPNDYPLLQSAIDSSASNDTIICDTVKDMDTIRIVNKVNLFIEGASPASLTQITKVLLVRNSTCNLDKLSFIGAKGYDGTNNNSCRYAPGLDGRAGTDAIIIDSSTVAVWGCTVRGGDGGSYGISYQSGMLCTCGSKGTPGTALRANNSTVTLRNDSLLSGQCAGASMAGCFTTNCTIPGCGCAGQNGSIIDTVNSRIDTISLDSTSTMAPAATMVKGRSALLSAAMRHGIFVSPSGIITVPDDFKMPYAILVYNVKGNLVLRQSRVAARRFDLGSRLAQGIYVISLQSANDRIMDKSILIHVK
jgi:hypothetical protein